MEMKDLSAKTSASLSAVLRAMAHSAAQPSQPYRVEQRRGGYYVVKRPGRVQSASKLVSAGDAQAGEPTTQLHQAVG